MAWFAYIELEEGQTEPTILTKWPIVRRFGTTLAVGGVDEADVDAFISTLDPSYRVTKGETLGVPRSFPGTNLL